MRENGMVVLCALAACGGEGVLLPVPGPAEIELALASGRAVELELPCGADVRYDDPTQDQRWTFTYSNGGRHEVDELRYADGTFIWRDIYDFDSAGRLLSWVEEGEYPGTMRVFYDAFGRRLRTEYDYNNNGTLDRVDTVTAWNDTGGATEGSLAIDGVVARTVVWSYDTRGRIIGTIYTNADETEYSHRTITYDDAAGTRLSETFYANGDRRRMWHSYDAASRLIGWKFDNGSDGPEDDSVTEREYDGNRLVRDVATWPLGGSLTSYDYDCD